MRRRRTDQAGQRRLAFHSSRIACTASMAALLCSITPQLRATAAPAPASPQQGSRPRELGVTIGVLDPGPANAITDVDGVLVGHTTLSQGDDIRTGVTAILPHGGNLFRSKVPAAVFVGNGFGKLTGTTQVRELGNLETPVILTGTLSVPRAADGLISYMLALPGNKEVRSINPVVGETNDGYLSDVRARPIRAEHVAEAIRKATPGPVAEGNVGAGTGTIAFGWKGGIGTASRRLSERLGGWTVGVLVQTNFGGVLQVSGAPVGVELGRYYLRSADAVTLDPLLANPDGSCMIVVATDAPLLARNLERLAARAIHGMARVGGSASNGSGDYVIAFSTAPGLRSGPEASAEAVRQLDNAAVSPLFLAVIEATEEAIINSMFAARTTDGYRGQIEALPVDAVLEILRRHKLLR